MVGKVIFASSFSGTVGYVMKEESRILEAEGVMPPEVKDMAQDFKDQTLLNPRLKNTVGHISLSFSPKDAPRMTDALMTQIAKEYMQKMGITDTQYLLARHLDQPHPHCHLVYNRVGKNGQTISDKNIKIRNAKVCRELTEKYGLYLAPGKDDVRRERLREPDKTRYEIYDAIKGNLPKCKNWNELEGKLKEQGIGVRYKYCGNTGRKQGVLFRKTASSSPARKSTGHSALRSSTTGSTIFNSRPSTGRRSSETSRRRQAATARHLQGCSAVWAAAVHAKSRHLSTSERPGVFRCRRPVRLSECPPSSCSASREKVPKSISHELRRCSMPRPKRWPSPRWNVAAGSKNRKEEPK